MAKKKTARKKATRKKVTRKKATRRKATAKKARGRKKAARRTGARAGLGRVSTEALREELDRRTSQLAERREEILAELASIEAEIGGGGGARRPAGRKKAARRGASGRRAGAGRRGRAKNADSLEASLARLLQGKTMGVSEAADAVQKAGYKTTSPNFRTIVNQCMLRSDLIKKVGRGQYTAA